MGKRLGIVLAVVVAACSCSHHPSAEERAKQEQERDQTLVMQKMLTSQLQRELDAGTPASSDSAASKALAPGVR
jgi:hypothetical protein